MKIHQRAGSVILALWTLSLGAIYAGPVTWSGGTTSTTWGPGTNWSTGSLPGTGDDVTIGDTPATRTITLDLSGAAASVSLSSLVLNQTTTGAMNQLALTGGAGTMSVANAITLGGGVANATSSILITGTTNASYVSIPSLAANGGMTINSGGFLQLAYNPTPRGFVAMTGSITLSGGIIEALSPSASQTAVLGSASTTNAVLAGNDVFTINSGTIKVDGTSASAGSRLEFSGNLVWNGGNIQLVSIGAASGQQGVWLHGLTNTISSTAVFQTVNTSGVATAVAPSFTMLISSGVSANAITMSQSLDTAVTLGLITLREFDTKANSSYTHRITSTAVGRGIGQIILNASGPEDILQLGSDLKSTYSTNGTFITAQGTGATYGVDLNGFTFDGTAAAAGWVPNLPGTTKATVWKVTSSTGTGTFKAQSFNLSMGTATSANTVSMGSNVILEATGGAGTGNVLSVAGGPTAVFDAASKFRYSGNATAVNAATMSSAVAIGGLDVANGALNIAQAALATQGDVTVGAGGSLGLNGASVGTISLAVGQDFTLGGGTMLLTLDLAGVTDQIISGGSGLADLTGGTLALSGNIDYNAAYTIFSGFSSITGANLVSITGYDSGYQATLSSAGILTFAVPEPSAIWMLGMGLAALMVGGRVKRLALNQE